MGERIKGAHVELDYLQIADFFENRGVNKKLGNKYNLVLFQDDNPSLAAERDRFEKEKIGEKLNVKKGARVLDIGCGIGRWGEYLLEKGVHYVGIDGSSLMIETGKENLSKYADKVLEVGFFQQLLKVLEKLNELDEYDLILVNGVFMYLNDQDFKKALKDIHRLIKNEGQFYLKESVGIEERLTLNKIYSESLTQTYSAIYRSEYEYAEAFMAEVGQEFVIVESGLLFEEALNNREDTADYYWIICSKNNKI